jgi:ABC-type xylose transport system permease subunit
MKSNALELIGIAMLLWAAYLVHPATIVGLAGLVLIAVGYTRSDK